MPGSATAACSEKVPRAGSDTGNKDLCKKVKELEAEIKRLNDDRYSDAKQAAYVWSNAFENSKRQIQERFETQLKEKDTEMERLKAEIREKDAIIIQLRDAQKMTLKDPLHTGPLDATYRFSNTLVTELQRTLAKTKKEKLLSDRARDVKLPPIDAHKKRGVAASEAPAREGHVTRAMSKASSTEYEAADAEAIAEQARVLSEDVQNKGIKVIGSPWSPCSSAYDTPSGAPSAYLEPFAKTQKYAKNKDKEGKPLDWLEAIVKKAKGAK
ncbi:unnamed protein product [Vitrella brassicaformis CCMP3155]|uniref:Uncharacterized protein n=2 Tax=Vitrella brassicaformis TaxID=1169539 RepID=A0A0G4GKK0_VITBC|nr:unnamed protein product [Vitrella brassicaformis CCMP3155]|eukprot:CEM30536.1 unnamed protein product [Vitrella brassicaformis CCMP3155]